MQHEMPFQPLGLDHAVLWIRDLPRAVRWYCEVLGCRHAVSYPEIGMEHLWFGTIILGLWDADDPRAAFALPPVAGGTNIDHLGLAVSRFEPDAIRAHLARHGVEIEKEVHQHGARGFGHSIYLRDPWGNRIELKGPAPFPT